MNPQPKFKPVRSRDYLAWIHNFPCVVCNKTPVESAHCGMHGLGTKADDIRTLPICTEHHRGPKGLDTLGPQRFEDLYKIDLKERVIFFLRQYMLEAGVL